MNQYIKEKTNIETHVHEFLVNWIPVRPNLFCEYKNMSSNEPYLALKTHGYVSTSSTVYRFVPRTLLVVITLAK
jgi:hypothetical protein